MRHNLETNHKFNFKVSEMLEYITINTKSIISKYNTIKQRLDFFNLSPYLLK